MKIFPSFTAIAFAVATSPALAVQPGALGNQVGNPANCLLNPWTGKLECVIWPTCTLDPWTGEMNCPVPRPALRAR